MSDYYKVLTARNPGNKENLRSFFHSRDDLPKSNIHRATQPARERRLKNRLWLTVHIQEDIAPILKGDYTISVVPACLSLRPNWIPPPLSRKRVCTSLGTKGEATLACGWGGANPDDWRERLALCALCDSDHPPADPVQLKTNPFKDDHRFFHRYYSSFLDDLTSVI